MAKSTKASVLSTSAQLAISIEQCVNAIASGGHSETVLVEGHMGSGKSTILKILAERLKATHKAYYFDCTTKDLGDLFIPKLGEVKGRSFVEFATNVELGAHEDRPIILMLDELGKANPAVKNALLCVMQEHTVGGKPLPEGSIVFATTNLGAEGVGDLMPPHGRNRITRVQMRKPDNMEWIEWGIAHDIDHTLLAFCKDYPQLFHTFEEVGDPATNPFIYHPSDNRPAFVTPRSLEKASRWISRRDSFDPATLRALLAGTIGGPAAQELHAYITLSDQLPSLDSIKKEPKKAKVPDQAGAVCMVVYRSLACIEADWIDAWMDYMGRMPKEAQAMFANGVRAPGYAKLATVLMNKKFSEWARENSYLYTADKK